MQAVTGVFHDLEQAKRAVERLNRAVEPERINLLTPGSTEAQIHSVPTTEDMPPVAGRMGAALGTALGLGVGVALVIPGVGQVTALGLAAAGLLGAAGGLGGYAAGDAVDRKTSTGLPVDELYVYEDALAKGRTVVVAMLHRDEQEAVRVIFEEEGAESIDQARQGLWDGLRDAEAREYEGDFESDEHAFRAGFEASQHPRNRDLQFRDAAPALRERHGDLARSEAFRRGYERGVSRLRSRMG